MDEDRIKWNKLFLPGLSPKPYHLARHLIGEGWSNPFYFIYGSILAEMAVKLQNVAINTMAEAMKKEGDLALTEAQVLLIHEIADYLAGGSPTHSVESLLQRYQNHKTERALRREARRIERGMKALSRQSQHQEQETD